MRYKIASVNSGFFIESHCIASAHAEVSLWTLRCEIHSSILIKTLHFNAYTDSNNNDAVISLSMSFINTRYIVCTVYANIMYAELNT